MAPASRMTARVMIVDLILVVSVSPVIPRDECGQGIPRMTSEFRSKFVVVSTWVRPGKWGCGATYSALARRESISKRRNARAESNMRGLETKIPVVLRQFFPFKFKRGLAGNHTNDRIRGCPPNRVSV